jgi:hypothetical protein
MTIELSKEELETIECWYNSAAGESASGCRGEEAIPVLTLIKKLGFEIHQGDAYYLKKAGLL